MRRKCFSLTNDDVDVIKNFLLGERNIDNGKEDVQALFRLLNDVAQVNSDGECEHSVLIMWVVSKVLSKKELSKLTEEIKRSRKTRGCYFSVSGGRRLSNEAYGCLKLVCELTKSNESEVIIKYLTPVLNILLSQNRPYKS